MAAKYTYKLEFTPASGELFIPDADAIYEWNKTDDSQGFMRQFVKELTITKDYDNTGAFTNEYIFNTLWEWYFDSSKHTTDIKLLIYKDGVLDFKGVFYITDGDIDVNNGVYTINAEPDDLYREFLIAADKSIDIIDGVESGYQARYQYHTELEEGGIGTGDPPDDSGTWVVRTAYPPFIWVRSKSQFDVDDMTTVTGVKIGDYWYYAQEGGITKNYYFPNCFLLIDTIQLILDGMLSGTSLSGMTFVSDFINDHHPINNYVTGDYNYLMNTLIEQNSDAKDINATNKATRGMISFTKLINDLCSMWDIKWFIDDNGDLRIEHRKYFYLGLAKSGNKTIGIDLTDAAKYKNEGANKLYIEDTQKYDNISNEKIKTETITFFGAETTDFRGDINYLSYDVVRGSAGERTHSVSELSTDLANVINNPTDIDDDGFHLFNCNSVYMVIKKPFNFVYPELDDLQYGNAGFGTKWLLRDYYEYGRQDKSATLTLQGAMSPSNQYSVIATVPIYQQKDIVFLLNNADSIDVNRYIATYLIKSDKVKYVVEGSILSISHDLNTDFVTATLGYES